MNKALQKLMIEQCLGAVLLFIISLLLSHRQFAFSVLMGGLIAWLASVIVFLFVRRLPDKLNAQQFYIVMIIAELLKWLSVIGFTILFVRYFSALGLIGGFAIVYVVSYMRLLKKE